ncbi:class I SAM-dependent methyltransferase [Natronoarchaeum mannanilyticum]
MTGHDPYGRAIRDHHEGEREEPLLDVDGAETREHPIELFYFDEFDPAEDSDAKWIAEWLDGPLLDIGAGAGQHALYLQERFETVAIDVSEHLVAVMRDRGVADARVADMFSLRESFERDRFGSALANGTQLGLAGSMRGLSEFLGDLAHVTTPDGTAVVDAHDPIRDGVTDILGYRSDPTPGLAHRTYHFEYEDDVGPTLQFRLFSPDRLREAAVGTGWEVAEIRRGEDDADAYYRAALVKP